MQTFKIENFERTYPGKQFPRHRTLSPEETAALRRVLAQRMGAAAGGGSGPMLVKAIAEQGEVITDANAEDEAFDLATVFLGGRIPIPGMVYVNWYHFDDIDQMRFADLVEFFDDIWYPAADDLDLFDDSVSWIVSISHEGDLSFVTVAPDSRGSE